MKNIIIALLYLLLSLNGFSSNSKQYKFVHLDNSNGLSNNQIGAIFKDSRGFLWIGTMDGLNRYDGYDVKVYRPDRSDPNSISESFTGQIFEDHKGKLWLLNNETLNIYNPELDVFKQEDPILKKNILIPPNYISKILKGNKQTLWFANSQHGLFGYSYETDSVVHLYNILNDSSSISSDNILDANFDSNGDLWLLHQNGIIESVDIHTLQVKERICLKGRGSKNNLYPAFFFIDSKNNKWLYNKNSYGLVYYNASDGRCIEFNVESKKYPLSNNIISGVVEGNNNKIWVATDHGGLNVIDTEVFQVEFITKELGVENSLIQNSIKFIYKDDDGIIWIGSYKNGVCYYHDNLFRFPVYQANPFDKKSLPYNDINCFEEDGRYLWLGTNGGGLLRYDKTTGNYKIFKHDNANSSSISNDVVVSLCKDSYGDLWVGTYMGGLNRFDGQRFYKYYSNENDNSTISNDNIWVIKEDSQKRLWIGTLGSGLDLYDRKMDRFIHYRDGDVNSVNSDFIIDIEEDHNGNIWFGTTFGINVLEKKTGRFVHYYYEEGVEGALSDNAVLCVDVDSKGGVWVGTRVGLNLFNDDKNQFYNVFVSNGLSNDAIMSVECSNNGDVWVGTSNGLSDLHYEEDLESGKMLYDIRNFDEADGLQGREFNERSSFLTSDGALLFGGVSGFNMFYPENIVGNNISSQVVLNEISLSNEAIHVGELVNGRVLLEKSLQYTEEITLQHDENIIYIGFSSLNFFHPEKVTFYYKLEGFNEEWVLCNAANRRATYTNLKSGNYIFRVKACNSEGMWCSSEAKLGINVLSSPLASVEAMVIYFVLLIVLIFLLRYIIVKNENNKFVRTQEQLELRRSQDIDRMKVKFFTNISHEFRTPLTLILSPLEKLLKISEDREVNKQLLVMQRNAKRLLNLVNQLLDLRKLEVDKMTFNKSYGNFIVFLKEVVNSFTDLAEMKGINLSFQSDLKEYFASFDHDKIEKIVFNLLSNAFKFTPANGSVTVDVHCIENTNRLQLKISDTGVGIEQDKLGQIFDRFFQVDNNSKVSNPGSGIGLSLVKEFVSLHQGEITVSSEVEKGTIFLIELPLAQGEGVAEEEQEVGQDLLDKRIEVPKYTIDESKQASGNGKKLLIVEDNEDLRFYLKDNFNEEYQVFEACNGKEGLEIALTILPDIVVSDIMMPELNGIDMCDALKKDQRTSHIPVILLSARSADEQKMEGLESGADAYVVKPFSFEELALRIKKLIEQREILRNSFGKTLEIKPSDVHVTSLDEKLVKKAIKLVEKHMEDPEFTVEKMSRELGFSRGHLYNKLMALTGKSPVEFIRILRIKRAAQLLEKSQLSVSDVAYKVGFNEPRYFSKYFKEMYNMSPSQYIKEHSQEF